MRRYFLFFMLVSAIAFQAIGDESIVARVNGAAIAARDVEEEIDRLIPRTMYHGNVSEERRNAFREKALNAVIDRELEYQDAVAKGMKPEKKKVKAQMEETRNKFRSKKEYKAALANADMTEDELRAKIEKYLLVQAVIIATVVDPAALNDAELKEYYQKNIEKFKQPESLKLRLISTKDEKKAKEALARIKAGEDFGTVAGQVSEDPFRVMGGDTGFQHKNRLLPEIEKATETLRLGEVSGIIRTEKDWVIIKIEDKKPETQLSYAEVKDKLKKELEKKRALDLQEKWLSDLKTKAKIEIFLKMEGDLTSKGQSTTVQSTVTGTKAE